MSHNIKTILTLITTSIILSACSDKNKETPVNTNNVDPSHLNQNNNNPNQTSQKPVSTNTPQTHAQLNQQAIEQNIRTKQASVEQSQNIIKQIYPRITIPKQPGNIKTLLSQSAQSSGYQLDWRLQGYYNLDEKTLQSFVGLPIGMVLMPLANLMTFSNQNLRLHWNLSNPGEKFPYPLEVAYIACGKSILVFEMDNKKLLPQLLTQKEYSTCSIPDGTTGVTLPQGANTTDMTQLDFSKPPPFVTGGTGNNGTIQVQIPDMPQSTNKNIPPPPTWALPTTGEQISISEPSLTTQVVKTNPQAVLNPQTGTNTNKAMQNLK